MTAELQADRLDELQADRLERLEARLEAVELELADARDKIRRFARGPGRRLLALFGLSAEDLR